MLVIGALVAAAESEYESARRKADLIESDQAKPGSTVSFSVAEANAYAREEARKEVGDGLRNTKVWFGSGTASGSATIDFVKVQTARGKPPGMLMRLMLEGEKDVQVTVRVESRGGQAKIDVDEVYINGLAIPKSAVNLLIDYYVMPRYPEAKIGQWFELRHRVDTIGVTAGGVALKFKP
ncbi:MAG: hypothetical protein IT168_08190 [Bryobacterales bacterium]|nr:hypothetical protein [Bryobacterales bacterium]